MSANDEAMNGAQTDPAPDIEPLPDDAEELRGRIEETRQDLGDTVEALAAKVDVKEQAREKLEAGKTRLREKGAAKPVMAAVGALLLLSARRRRRARKARRS